MGREKKAKAERKRLEQFKITLEELDALLRRLETRRLVESDYPLIVEIIKNFAQVETQAKQNKSTAEKLQKLLFGPKTERSSLPSDFKSRSDGDTPPGHGKKPALQWVDKPCETCLHPHDQLEEGQLCPKCKRGKLYFFKPSVRIRIVGNRILDVEQHEIERLRCSACGWLYTAQPSEDLRAHPEATPQAMALSALLRYQSGFPTYRLIQFLKVQGVYLTWSKVWNMILGVFEVAEVVVNVLWKMAAEAILVQNDDTPMRVIELKKIPFSEDKERKAIQTTGLLVQLADKRKILFYKTGHKNAGENLEELLSSRISSDPPMHMADALTANDPKSKIQRGNCLDHFRRDFYDLYDDWPQECEFILTSLREIYKVDALAKKQKLTPAQRLKLHQEKSQPHIDAIYSWINSQKANRTVEPNSNLGKAMQYGLNHQAGLTAFLRLEGMPIANIEVEQLLKKAIAHRKNSLSYKTKKGAYVGDVLMSLIQTAAEAKENVYHYLASLVENPKDVKEQPEQWLPWNYLQRLISLKPVQA